MWIIQTNYAVYMTIYCNLYSSQCFSLQWRHNEHNGVSNYRRLECLLNRLSGHRSKKTSKLCVTGFCDGNSPLNSPHKGPVTQRMLPFDDIIVFCMLIANDFMWCIACYVANTGADISGKLKNPVWVVLSIPMQRFTAYPLPCLRHRYVKKSHAKLITNLNFNNTLIKMKKCFDGNSVKHSLWRMSAALWTTHVLRQDL